MNSVYKRKEDCCGCTACEKICPEKAILMKPDDEGFLYSEVNKETCIKCGLCMETCFIHNDNNNLVSFIEPDIYALKHRSLDVINNSSSGGAFTAISDYFLSIDGVIYGASFDDFFNVVHYRERTIEGRNKFRGSKYVQSNLTDILYQIRCDLEDNKFVLFSGTPCQVVGVKKYLEQSKVKIDQLFLVDLICHGVASPLLWREFLHFIQKKTKLKSYTFRSKEKDWKTGHHIKAVYENKKINIDTLKERIFINLYNSNLILRPSCYNCKFCNLNHPSDITIGDFWGIEKVIPEMNDGKGVSLVIINTEKGRKIFTNIQDKVISIQTSIKDCIQPNLEHPTKMPKNRNQFWQTYNNYNFRYIASKYGKYTIKRRIKEQLGEIYKKLIKVLS